MEEKFKWVEMFEEISQKLYETIDDNNMQLKLVKFANSIKEKKPFQAKKIDPFTLFAIIVTSPKKPYKTKREERNKKNKRVTKIEAFRNLLDILNIHNTNDLLKEKTSKDDAWLNFNDIPIPIPSALKAWYFGAEQKSSEIENNINMFKIAMIYANKKTHNAQENEEFLAQFNRCLKNEQVELSKLSMGLFYIKPTYFVSLESKTKEYSDKILSYKYDEKKENYLEIMNKLKQFSQMEPYQLALEGEIYSQKEKVANKGKKKKQNDDKGEISMLDSYKQAGNVIFYGVPGCGKSYEINKMLENEKNVKRLLFYPDYSYGDFVGQILPNVVIDGAKETVTYKFSAGPFTKILEDAIYNENEDHYLIIEEINRGNAPAIFGDIFQLLDRKNGESEYPINNKQIIDYWKDLATSKDKEVKNKYTSIIKKLEKKDGMLYIPKNLIIFATMNTCDQNVFILDTAFKRRWTMHRIYNDFSTEYDILKADIKSAQIPCTWGQFAKAINNAILNDESSINAEDKLLGTHFVKPFELEDTKNNFFAEKVLMYLWEDVVKFNPHILFEEEVEGLKINSLESLLIAYKKYGMKVIREDVLNS